MTDPATDAGVPDLPPPPPVPGRDPAPAPDLADLLDTAVATGWATDLLLDAGLGNPRSRQVPLGASEVGSACDRRIAYRLAGVTPVALPDPLKALVGTAFHAHIAHHLAGNPRYLIEHPTVYREVPGTVDCYDRVLYRAVDWKTTSLANLKRYLAEGPSWQYRIQVNIYAHGLMAAGLPVRSAWLVYVPRDGAVGDVQAVPIPIDKHLTDQAIDRVNHLRTTRPGMATPTPGPLCNYCAHYLPGSTDPDTACPGPLAQALTEGPSA